jgi:drug/metabolite transporter (DMT)-like permease
MIAAAAFFALMGACIKLVGTSLGLADIVFYRTSINFVAAAALLYLHGQTWRSSRTPLHVWRSILGLTTMVLTFYALTQLPLATATTLSYTSPIFLALLSMAVLGARPTWPLSIAVALGFVGVIVLLKPTLAPTQYLAAAVGLASGFVGALAYHSIGKLVRTGEPETRVVFYFALLGTIGSAAWLTVTGWHSLDAWSTLYALGAGLFGTLGQLCMTRAYGRGHPMITGALSYSTIAFSCVLGYVIWTEALLWTSWAGIALIVASGLLAMRSRHSNADPHELVAANE